MSDEINYWVVLPLSVIISFFFLLILGATGIITPHTTFVDKEVFIPTTESLKGVFDDVNFSCPAPILNIPSEAINVSVDGVECSSQSTVYLYKHNFQANNVKGTKCKPIMGYECWTVKGSSMQPAIWHNNTVLVNKQFNKENLQEGMITVFDDGNGFTIHTVTGIYSDGFDTQGYANGSSDGMHDWNALIGIVEAVYYE